MSITATEKKSIEGNFPREKYVAGAACLYKTSNGSWVNTNVEGAVVVFQRDTSVFIQIVEVSNPSKVNFEHELSDRIEFKKGGKEFSYFEGDGCAYGFLFADEKEGDKFAGNAKIKPLAYRPSQSFSADEKKGIEKFYAKDKTVFGAVQLYKAPGSGGRWNYTEIFGILVVAKEEYEVNMVIHEPSAPYNVKFKHEMFENIIYNQPTKLFTFFNGDSNSFGFLFTEFAECSKFIAEAPKFKPEKRKGKSAIMIGTPSNFNKDMGMTNQSDNLDDMHPGLKEVFKSNHIKKKDIMGDNEAIKFLLEISSKYGGQETVPKEALDKIATIIERIQKSKQRSGGGGGGGGRGGPQKMISQYPLFICQYDYQALQPTDIALFKDYYYYFLDYFEGQTDWGYYCLYDQTKSDYLNSHTYEQLKADIAHGGGNAPSFGMAPTNYLSPYQ